MKIKILLAENHKVVREGIRSWIENENDIELLGEVAGVQEALKEVRSKHPTLVIIDLKLPHLDVFDFLRRLNKEDARQKVLVLATPDHDERFVELWEAGVTGYIHRSVSKEEFLFSVRRIAAGAIYITPEASLSLLIKTKPEANGKEHNHNKREQLNISDREMEVLYLVAQGKTNSEIAQTLFTSVRTIETRRKNLLDKTKTNNTATLIRYAVQNGLVK